MEFFGSSTRMPLRLATPFSRLSVPGSGISHPSGIPTFQDFQPLPCFLLSRGVAAESRGGRCVAIRNVPRAVSLSTGTKGHRSGVGRLGRNWPFQQGVAYGAAAKSIPSAETTKRSGGGASGGLAVSDTTSLANHQPVPAVRLGAYCFPFYFLPLLQPAVSSMRQPFFLSLFSRYFLFLSRLLAFHT